MNAVIFDPLVPPWALGAMAAAALLLVALAGWRRLPGWGLRLLAGAVIVASLANPSLQREQRDPLKDIVLLVLDDSASQRIGDRAAQTAAAAAGIAAEVARLDNTELRTIHVGDDAGDGGTLLMSALSEGLASEPQNRIAGAILVTDGQVHDLDRAPDLPAPLHVLQTGHRDDWDRRLVISSAPAFAILDEEIHLVLEIEDSGASPAGDGRAPLEVSIDGDPPQSFVVPVGVGLDLPVTLRHGGMNVIRFTTPAGDGELTDRNNATVVQINGVRDRLRVLLVSGEPYPGERVWRNLLKSDSSVDLVHFTILRPPEKQDGVPVTELSLIAFPTRELFLEKIDQFDLIVFDRYRLRGILPQLYIDNIRNYVENGGAVLVAAGPDFASAASLARSPLGDILPVQPTGRVFEQGYRPQLTGAGHRHPVTAGLDGAGDADTDATWGRWFRQVELVATGGSTVMAGIDGAPLLVLNRVGQGRVAVLGSDHAWLWGRGYEGGGPQLELLRRVAHWSMQEPELDEESLTANAEGLTMTIERRTLSDAVAPVAVTGPDGQTVSVDLAQDRPGRFLGSYAAPEIGLYRLREGDKTAVLALGPAAPREFEVTVADSAGLAPLVSATRGGVRTLEDGLPRLRQVREGRVAAGRGWLGITPRGAYVTADIVVFPLLPAWLLLALAALLAVGAWLREGRS